MHKKFKLTNDCSHEYQIKVNQIFHQLNTYATYYVVRNKKIIPQFSIVYKICARKCLEFKASKLIVKWADVFQAVLLEVAR